MSSSSYSFDFEGLKEKEIERACHVSIKAHKKGKPYVVDKKLAQCIVIAFPGSWSVNDWYAGDNPFGETKVDLNLFPSLRSIGNYEGNNDKEVATVNQAFLQRFLTIKREPKASFCKDVEKAVKEKKKIIFAGHSSGGPTAIFAAIWFFEEYIRLKEFPPPRPFCLTFGSPLTADRIFCHAVRREKWSDYFINFVTRYDIVPRIMLAPQSSIVDELRQVLLQFDPVSPSYATAGTGDDTAKNFFEKVMESASCAASYAASTLMGGGADDLLSTLLNFIDPSPYRPFGTYVYCSENWKPLLAVKNPGAVFQLLFYSAQPGSQEEFPDMASKSLKCHLEYETKLQGSLKMQNVHLFDGFKKIPIFLDDGAGIEATAIHEVLNDLGVTARGRMSLHAAVESEKQKWDNQDKFEKLISKRTTEEDSIDEMMEKLKSYRTSCKTLGKAYYDSFKESENEVDFEANVARLKLAGIWDEIIEMLRRYELPDTFEGDEIWINRGTEFRRLVEPLDIANFYRHTKYEDSGPYMGSRGRPRRYRYTQRWLEHFEKLPRGSHGESCFWADMDEHLVDVEMNRKSNINVKQIDQNLRKWRDAKWINEDVFQSSTLIKWWNRLPESLREESCIKEFIQQPNGNKP